MKDIFLSVFLLTPFNCHSPGSSHAILLLSFLEHQSIYDLSPQGKLISRYTVNSHSLIILLKYFVFQCYYISLSLSSHFFYLVYILNVFRITSFLSIPVNIHVISEIFLSGSICSLCCAGSCGLRSGISRPPAISSRSCA